MLREIELVFELIGAWGLLEALNSDRVEDFRVFTHRNVNVDVDDNLMT